MDGIIVVNKEKDYTSFDVVAKLRGILHVKKIGHTGTLDPMATGVLPVCLGAGTKLCDALTDTRKIYRTVLLLGEDYDTEDITGTLLAKSDVRVSEEELKDCISSFVGRIEQVPPMYSAVKIGGKKLYELARKGQEVARTPRSITIRALDCLGRDPETGDVLLRVCCSKGTYIRTLCREIGEKLGCHGCMAELTRVYTGGFDLDEAKTIDEIRTAFDNGTMEELIYGVDDFYKDLPQYVLQEKAERYADNGNRLFAGDLKRPDKAFSERIRVYRKDGFFYGVYSYDGKNGYYRPEQMYFCKGTCFKECRP